MTNSIRGRLFQAGIAAAAALMVTTAAPVLAAPGDTNTSASQSANTQGSTRAAARNERRICVSYQSTGTRLERRVCRTQAEWDREGGVPSE